MDIIPQETTSNLSSGYSSLGYPTRIEEPYPPTEHSSLQQGSLKIKPNINNKYLIQTIDFESPCNIDELNNKIDKLHATIKNIAEKTPVIEEEVEIGNIDL